MNKHHNQYLGAIIGHAVGDAMGFPTEFSKREELLNNPVLEMIDSPDVGQPAGSWSDDTAMEIATIDSFIQKKCFDYKDIMDKWVKWISKSEYTPTGVAFDIGRTCLKAIKKYCNGTAPLQCGATSMNENGNGSLMRILPVALYAYSKNLDDISIRKLTNEVSSLTHAHGVSRLGCYIYVQFIICLLKGYTKEDAYKHIQNLDYSSYDMNSINLYTRILNERIKSQIIDGIKSSGYIIDTLECVMWIFMNAQHYKEAIIASTNIGGDTDTIGAIVGSMGDKEPIDVAMQDVERDPITELAKDLDDFAFDYDFYGYQDAVDDRTEHIESLKKDLETGNVEGLTNYLKEVIE